MTREEMIREFLEEQGLKPVNDAKSNVVDGLYSEDNYLIYSKDGSVERSLDYILVDLNPQDFTVSLPGRIGDRSCKDFKEFKDIVMEGLKND